MHPLTRALRSLYLVGLCLIVVGALLTQAAGFPLTEANKDFTLKGWPIHPSSRQGVPVYCLLNNGGGV